jgi:predicted restriction endonuclease
MTTSDSVQKFLANLDSVRVHKSPDGTRALKKPLTLLVVISRIMNGVQTTNELRFADFETQLRDLIAKFGNAASSSPSPADPFFYLHTSPFWRLEFGEGVHRPKKPSASLLRKPGTHAALDADLFAEMTGSKDSAREAMQGVLAKWWPEGAPEGLTQQLGI